LSRPFLLRVLAVEWGLLDTGNWSARGEGHVTDARAGCGEEGVCYRRSNADQPTLTGAGGRQVFSVEEHEVDLRRVHKARHTVLREVRVFYFAVFEEDALEERAANSLHDGSHVLVAQAVGIDDGA